MSNIRTSQTQRQSTRLHGFESSRVLDEVARKRRLRKQLEALEQASFFLFRTRITSDNFHEDPHAHLQWHKNIPKFEDEQQGQSSSARKTDAESGRKRKKFKVEHRKQRFRKNFSALVEETLSTTGKMTGFDAYEAARALPSRIPPRHFCAGCGFFAKYSCIRCGTRYCSISCRDLHNDTR
ncbi:unnamed protein product [Thelazia callipaeda]|uniref:HIT-type domain-containing protein n=1 Tax=Thelazia callipaeda TaxID=103827 RepID=A0A0N5CKN4_THECL|nr:unnamed protein product [Thelazia callipaeda]